MYTALKLDFDSFCLSRPIYKYITITDYPFKVNIPKLKIYTQKNIYTLYITNKLQTRYYHCNILFEIQ